MIPRDDQRSSTCPTNESPNAVIRDASVQSEPPQPNPEYDMPAPMLSDAQVQQLAMDIRAGLIFGSWCFCNLDEQDRLVESVFKFGDLRRSSLNFGYLYEYLDRASTARVENYPVFYSAHLLTWVDANRVNAEIAQQATADGARDYPQIYEPWTRVARVPWWRRLFRGGAK